MNKYLKIAGLVGLFVLVFAGVGLVYAQTEAPQPYTGFGYGHGMMGGRGAFSGSMVDGEEGPFHEIMVNGFAEVIGLSVEQLEARLEAGETMWQIAESEGLTWDEFIAAMQQARSTMLEQAVEDGLLSQEHADFMNSRGMTGGYGQGTGSCWVDGQSGLQNYHRGRGGMWGTP